MSKIQEIHSKKILQGKVLYFVKFIGKPDTENAWVSEDKITNLQEVLSKFDCREGDEQSIIKFRKGSFSSGDEVSKIVQIIWNEEKSQSMGEVEWRSPSLYNALYPLPVLHEKCPREMCEIYYSLLKFTYSP